MPTKDRKMHAGAEAVHMEVGQRVALWLRQAYPRDGAKLAANDFDASPHTTKKWFAGALPENRHMTAMAKRWGKRFLAFVYEPAVGPWRDYVLHEELQDLKSRLARLEADTNAEMVLQGDAGFPPMACPDPYRQGGVVGKAAGDAAR